MSSEWMLLQNGLCRCCHAEGVFKTLNDTCLEENLKESYLEMFRDVFNIVLHSVRDDTLPKITLTICDTCVLRLQDASSFKKQVLACEEKLKDLFTRNLVTISEPEFDELKTELPELPDEKHDQLSDNELSKNYESDNEDSCEDSIKLSDLVTKKRRKHKDRSYKIKKKVGRPRKVKEEAADEVTDVEKETRARRTGVPKFRLQDDDYTRIGDSYQCNRCDKRYDKTESLRFHVKTKHYKIPKYHCSYCKETFMTEAPLTLHKLQEHNIDERFKCKACTSVFNTRVQLKKHVNIYHMLGAKYKCDVCDYESFSFEGMYKHKFKHKTSKDYHCRFCRKSFLRKTTLDLHERIHTGDRRKVCNVCGQAFVQKASLNYHMTKYHPEVNF